jgi:hypothetical protein
MAAVVYRLRTIMRARWAAVLGVTLVVTIACAIVLAFAAGAQRTLTAPDRYTTAFGSSFDALVTQDGGAPRTAEVRALPDARSVEPVTFFFGAVGKPGSTDSVDALPFSGTYGPDGSRLIGGRPADPNREGEFVANRKFFSETGAALGDHFDLATLTQAQADANGFDTADPQGPRVDAVLVGEIDGPEQLDDSSAEVIFSSALLADHKDIGVSETLMAVQLRSGVDLAAFRTQLDTLPNSRGLSLERGVVVSGTIRRAVDAEGRGLWLLAGVAALAAIAVLGQLITRQVRLSAAERERLTAIGCTDGQLFAESLGLAAVPIIVGCVVGAALAVIPSGVFPFGFVRRLEPTTGVRFDATVLLAGAALFLAALVLWTAAALTLHRWTSHPVHPSTAVEQIATRTTSASATGLRFAFTRRGRDRGSARAAVTGVLLTVAGLVGAITFGISLDRLVHDPVRFGSNYDVAFGDNGAGSLPTGLREALDSDPGVASLMLYANDHARVGGTTVPVLGMEAVRGDGTPTVVSGRLPASEDEIAFGRVTARAVGAHVGGTLTLTGTNGPEQFRVTGIVIVPGFGANDGMGEGGIVTEAGLDRVDDAASFTGAAVRLKPGTTLTELATRLPIAAQAGPTVSFQPPAIVNVARIRAIPFVLAVLLGALALLTIVHVMITSLRSRQRDLAVLRALGADRPWVTRAVHWEATVFTLLPLAIGIPLGVIAGRTVFTVFADSMGALDAAAIPFALVAAVAAVFMVLANVIAAVPAHRARRILPAVDLNTE